MRIRLGARKSDLARIQAYEVGDFLQQQNKEIQIEYYFRQSLGDQNLDDPLWKLPEKGVFTRDFYKDLLAGKLDMVVHSWKDLPVENEGGTRIFMPLLRADSRDMLLIRRDKEEAIRDSGELRVLTSSPRRKYNLEKFLPTYLPFKVSKLEFVDIRGNVPTRLDKLLNGEAEAMVLAKAAVDRLLTASREEFASVQKEIRQQLEHLRWMVLPISENPPAAAQGALAVEVREDNEPLCRLLKQFEQKKEMHNVKRERQILKSHGGGCHQKIGVSVLSTDHGPLLVVRGETDAGESLSVRKYPNMPPPVMFDKNEIFPRKVKDSKWFRREPIPVAKAPQGDFWVTRSEALPDSWCPEGMIWTSGLITWKKLAERGFWVTGCAEGLGENWSPQLDVLHGSEVHWKKLSHEGGWANPAMKLVPTYRLVPLEKLPDLKGKKCFYWMSSTQFELALTTFPNIVEHQHSCGPGYTYRVIRAKLGPQAKLRVFASYEDWLKGVSE